ncbi:DUF885 domain-containing protein [Umezawaea beigongshangensis]|uniref:DUF885 domain-containing protein n=1 Tax=Umezawaea beigongshangensis TaxID=2780383 RepID=UPI0018F1634B|nr:DUF885 domain-containing protein [Umezawaea beigongshangensis]
MTETEDLAAELLDLVAEHDPLGATLYGVPGHEHRLGDRTAAGEESVRHRALDVAARASAVETDDEQDRITLAVVVQQAEALADQLAVGAVEFTITDSFFAAAGELLFVMPMSGVTTPEQRQAYLTRLSGVPGFLEAVATRHREGVAAGRTPVAHLVRAAVAHLDRYLAAPEADPLGRPSADDPAFTAERDRLLAEVVRPAFAVYRDVLADELEPVGRPADRAGLRWLTGGDDAYSALARVHTTTDRTPDELHRTGLDVMAGLEREYAEIGQRVFGTSDLREIFTRMRTDAALRWNDADELLEAARAAVVRAEEAAPRWFGTLPAERCLVKAVPEAEGPGAPTAYYMAAALDGSRQGTYYANTYKARERDRYVSEAIAFHEAVPGHHFQISLAQQLADLPMLRRIASVTAYLEGWGLYCERLADEMGLYSSDLARLGMLSMDSLRASRLVCDTGLHAKGWSREQAIAYMRDNTALAPVEIENEVDRYLAAPGQALAYMVGRLEIQRIRAAAEEKLGSSFDVRAFHDLVLAGGPLPLAVLDGVVAEWAARG